MIDLIEATQQKVDAQIAHLMMMCFSEKSVLRAVSCVISIFPKASIQIKQFNQTNNIIQPFSLASSTNIILILLFSA